MGVPIEKMYLISVLLRLLDPLIGDMSFFAFPKQQISVDIIFVLRQTLLFLLGHKQDYEFSMWQE